MFSNFFERSECERCTEDFDSAEKLGERFDKLNVNANKRHWYKAGEALARADRSWLARLITRQEQPENFRSALERKADDIKVVIRFAEA